MLTNGTNGKSPDNFLFMRVFIGFLLGVMFTCWCWSSWQDQPVEKNKIRMLANAPDSTNARARKLVQELPAGQLSAEELAMFHVIFPPDPASAYYEPDRSNTRIYYLDRLGSPYSDQWMILIETGAGYAGGSCGPGIKAGWYYPYEERWELLVNECGAIDTVYSLFHNGCLDFATANKWGENKTRYQYDGSTYVAYDEVQPLNDTDQIAHIVALEMETDDGYIRESVLPRAQWNYVILDSTDHPYLFLQCEMTGLFLIHEVGPGEFALINFLKGDMELDILNKIHNGFPDIKTFNTGYEYRIYRWNGAKYILHHTEEWVCPA